MCDISVVIPTRNRQTLLFEAIQSVKKQTCPAKEIIIVDDASTEPVDQQFLRETFGSSVQVIRNEKSRGLAWARYRGVSACTAEYVTHLDDDDLYDKNYLKRTLEVFNENQELQVLFVGVTGFGKSANNFNQTQSLALKSINVLTGGGKVAGDIHFYGEELFPVMLKKVSMPFQRIVTTLETWNAISELRKNAYALVNHVAINDEVFNYLDGPLRDSEWSIYAAVYCKKSALLNKPLYLQRCDGQGYSSKEDQRYKHAKQNVIIKSTIYAASDELKELQVWKKEVRNAAESALFNIAYYYTYEGRRYEAWNALRRAFMVAPKIPQLKLFFRNFLRVKSG